MKYPYCFSYHDNQNWVTKILQNIVSWYKERQDKICPWILNFISLSDFASRLGITCDISYLDIASWIKNRLSQYIYITVAPGQSKSLLSIYERLKGLTKNRIMQTGNLNCVVICQFKIFLAWVNQFSNGNTELTVFLSYQNIYHFCS